MPSPPIIVGTFLALVHLLTIFNYGIFRDEFYYLACGRHLAWGYVDHPPFVALMARVGTGLFGNSLIGIRWLSILCGVLTVFTTGAFVTRLGGGRFAVWLATIAVAFAPHYGFTFHVLSMNSAEVLFWTLAGYCLWVALLGDRLMPWMAPFRASHLVADCE